MTALDSDIDGATLLRAPQFTPIFSYSVGGGTIQVHVVESGVVKFAVIAFEGECFAVVTLDHAFNFAQVLVRRAWRKWSNYISPELNPFAVLLHDKDAMKKLQGILRIVCFGE